MPLLLTDASNCTLVSRRCLSENLDGEISCAMDLELLSSAFRESHLNGVVACFTDIVDFTSLTLYLWYMCEKWLRYGSNRRRVMALEIGVVPSLARFEDVQGLASGWGRWCEGRRRGCARSQQWMCARAFGVHITRVLCYDFQMHPHTS